MQNLESSFSEIVTNLVTGTRLNDYVASCLYQHPATIKAAKQITALISDAQVDSDAQSLLNHITGKYLISLHVAYEQQIQQSKKTTNEDEDEDETSEKPVEYSIEEIISLNLHRIFAILDLTIHIDEVYSEYSSYSMHTFVSILSYIYPIEFIVKHLAPLFFNEEGKQRRLLLTKGNKLQGKVKPGSRLLVIYKQIVSRIPEFEPSNDSVIAKFRQFICNSFEIGDKLSQSSNWHMAQKTLNGYHSSFEGYYDAKKLNSSKPNSRGGKSQRNVFVDYITLMRTLTTHHEGELIQALNKGLNSSNSLNLRLIEDINRTLDSVTHHNHRTLVKLPLNEKSTKQTKWVLDEETFNAQVKTYDFYWSLKIQLAILANFFNEMSVEKWRPNSETISKEYSKFKKPDVLINPITSFDSKRKVADWLTSSLNAFKQKNFHHAELLDIFENNEKTFSKMKLKNFVHPEISQLSEISNSKKRNLAEYIAEAHDLERSIVNKRPKFVHSLGTPKLSKLWGVQTGLKSSAISEWKDCDDVLESVKDDVYFARGAYEENPADTAAAETYTRLCWKGLRSIKEQGSWLELATCNEFGEVAGDSGKRLF